MRCCHRLPVSSNHFSSLPERTLQVKGMASFYPRQSVSICGSSCPFIQIDRDGANDPTTLTDGQPDQTV